MTSESLKQLARHISRLKFQRDEEARLTQAGLEGEARGEARSEARSLKVGRITLLQELLGNRPSTVEEFAGYDETQLNDLADQLQQQLRSRGE